VSSFNPYQSPSPANASMYMRDVAANAAADVRLQFIRMTYLHLGLAVLAFIGIEFLLFMVFSAQLDAIVPMLLNGYAPLVFFGAFMVVSWVADSWAQRSTNRTTQYAALAVYVLAEAIFFVPLLYIADRFFPGAIQTAGIVTGIIFAGLTAGVFITRVDFSFLRMYLMLGSLAAFAVIIAGLFMGGITGGVVFPGLMIMLASGYILYDTSRVMQHYHTSQYVAASLALFASVALLFWYVLRLVMAMRR